jgi:hypothetical protein
LYVRRSQPNFRLRRTSSTMKPILVEVIAPLLDGWGMCSSCEMLIARANLDKGPYERGLEEYPPDWQADFQHLSDLIIDLSARYGDRILIKIFDPRSLQGMIKSIRYRVRRYPTFIVDGGQKITGLDAAKVEQALSTSGATRQAAE